MSTTATTTPPIAKKVWVGLLLAIVAAVIQAVIPGYSPDPIVQNIITLAVGYAASFLVKEEESYLVPALAQAQKKA